jgi:hypothetical protein
VGSPLDALVRQLLSRQQATGQLAHTLKLRESLLRSLAVLCQLHTALQRQTAASPVDLQQRHARAAVDYGVLFLCATAAYRRWRAQHNLAVLDLARSVLPPAAATSEAPALDRTQFAAVMAKLEPAMDADAVNALFRAAAQLTAVDAVFTARGHHFAVATAPQQDLGVWRPARGDPDLTRCSLYALLTAVHRNRRVGPPHRESSQHSAVNVSMWSDAAGVVRGITGLATRLLQSHDDQPAVTFVCALRLLTNDLQNPMQCTQSIEHYRQRAEAYTASSTHPK